MSDVQPKSNRRSFRASGLKRVRQVAHWSLANVPWGVRAVLGLLFVVGGFFGFLPVLGFWMIPLGLVLIVLDVPPWRKRVLTWLRQRHRKEERAAE